MSAAIEVKNLKVRYRAEKNVSIKDIFSKKKKDGAYIEALKGVSFEIPQGEVVGIIGKNGSGKSTLLRTLAGVFCADEGTVDLHGQKVSLLSLGVGFKSELSGRENIMLSGLLMGFTKEEVERQMQGIIDFSEIGEFIDKPVKTYSSGMYSKLAFALAVSLKTEIILIDEVLSVGDEHFREKSFNKIKELIGDKTRTVVIVSHDTTTLEKICDRIIWLHDGVIKEFGETKPLLEEYKKFMV